MVRKKNSTYHFINFLTYFLIRGLVGAMWVTIFVSFNTIFTLFSNPSEVKNRKHPVRSWRPWITLHVSCILIAIPGVPKRPTCHYDTTAERVAPFKCEASVDPSQVISYSVLQSTKKKAAATPLKKQSEVAY